MLNFIVTQHITLIRNNTEIVSRWSLYTYVRNVCECHEQEARRNRADVSHPPALLWVLRQFLETSCNNG